LDNMDQGVVMFDDAGRLVICNDRYSTMYELPPSLVRPGTALADIVRYRVETGTLQADPERYYAGYHGGHDQRQSRQHDLGNAEGARDFGREPRHTR